MKKLILLLFATLFIAGCNYKETDRLQEENRELNLQVEELKTKVQAQKDFLQSYKDRLANTVVSSVNKVEVYTPATLTCGERIQVIKIDQDRGWAYMQWGEDLKKQSDPLYFEDKTERNTIRLDREGFIRLLSVENCDEANQTCTIQCVDVQIDQ